MSVSFEIDDAQDAPAAVATPVMVERPKSAMQARQSLLISMFACIDEGDMSAEAFHLRNICLYPLQISVDHAEVVHILQAICDINQLNSTLVRALWGRVIAYELNAVNMPIPLDKLVDISVVHPLGDQKRTGVRSLSLQGVARCWDAGGVSKQHPLDRISMIHPFRRMRRYQLSTHAEDDI